MNIELSDSMSSSTARTASRISTFLFKVWPLLLFLFLVSAPLAAADLTGFLPAKGHGTVAVGYTNESYDEFFRGTEKVPLPGPLGEISTTSYSFWMNYGLTDRLALIVNAAYVEAEADGPSGLSDSGPQDLAVLLAMRLWESTSGSGTSHSLVGAIGGSTPTESYTADSPVARGDKSTDALLRLVYLLHKGSFYWSQQVGYDLRSDDPPNGIPLYTELGLSTGHWTWIVWYSQYLAQSGTDIGDPGFTFPSNQEDLQRLGAKAVVTFPNGWGGVVGAFTTLDGRNTGYATGLSVGLLRQF